MAGLELDVRVKNLEQATREIEKKMEQAGKKAEQSLAGGAEKGLSRVEKQVSRITQMIGAGLIVRGFQRLAGGVLTLAGNLEQAQIAFTTMLGSASKAQVTLTELSKFAQKTPFELTGIRQNAKQLLAMGIESQNLIPTLKALGDVSAGLNVPLERLALNYGQVISQGKLTGRELRDFTIAGVPILEELANMLGKTREEITEMISASEITSDIVVKAFKRMSGEGGRFANLMDQQSTTLQGSLSNLKDAFDTLAEVVGSLFIPILTKAVQAVIPVIERIRERVKDNPKLAKAIGVAVTVMVALVGVLGVIGPLLGLIALGFGTMLGPVLAVVAGVTALAGGFAFLTGKAKEATDVAGKAKKEIRELEKEQKKLNKQLEKGKITWDEYNGRMKDNEELIRQNQELVDGSATSLGDLQLQMKGLNDQKLNLETQAFKDQRDEIVKNINALRAYKAELLSVKIQEYDETLRAYNVQQETGVGVGGLQAGLGSPLGGITNQKVFSQTEQSLNTLSQDIASLSREVDTLQYYTTDFDKAMGEVAETIADTSEAIDGTGGGGGAIDNFKDLKEEIDDTGDQAQKVIAKFEDLQDASADLTSNMKDHFRELGLQIRGTQGDLTSLQSEFNKDIARIESGRGDDLAGNQKQFIRSQLQAIQEAQAKLDELAGEGIVLGSDVEKQKAIIESAQQALSNQELVSQELLAKERERLTLTEQELQLQEFITKEKEIQAQADEQIAERTARFEEQQKKLQETLRILQFFRDFDFENTDQLQQLIDSPELAGLSVEGQTFVQRLAQERLELEKQKEYKLELEQQLQSELVTLNNQYTTIMRSNVQSLGQEYQNIISLIQRAINLQSTLNSGVGIQQRFAGGPVQAGQPYLVGENTDGSLNKTTELFIPKQAGSIANAQQVQQAMKEVMAQSVSNDNSRKVEVGSIHYETQADFETFFEKLLFKL